ncbi:HNH endonuclease [Vibrio parahaemolyticus]
MKCIFCKQDSSDSRSVEHIIPESLGNKNSVLPRGAVCDSCNNYFASNVEKPVLDSSEFVQLRFNQLIKNKKGRVPKAKVLFGNDVVTATRTGRQEFSFNSSDFSKIVEHLNTTKRAEMRIPVTGESASEHHISRFLAKMALEALAHRWLELDSWNEDIINHEQLDLIRKFARYPKRGEVWEYSKRRIYSENSYTQQEVEDIPYQIVNEWDILVTGNIDNSEFYFVVAIFGVEYAINLGGNSMDGYKAWLAEHDDVSPLYYGKNIT